MSEHQFREDGSHYNGGDVFFGYGYRAVGEPRLKMIRRWYRQGKMKGVTEDRYFVDGDHVADYAEAIERLKTEAALAADERPILALFTNEPARRPAGDIEVILRLRAKGFVFANDGLFSLTDAGRTALQTGDKG